MRCRYLEAVQRAHSAPCVRTRACGRKPTPVQPQTQLFADRPYNAPEQKLPFPSSQISRRQHLLGLLAAPLGLVAVSPSRAASSDLLEGTQNWFNIGVQSYGLWAQSLFDAVSNDDQIGLAAAVGDEEPRRRHFGSISVPGLSSFSFIHGTLVGGLLILLLAADKLSPGQQQSTSQQQQQQVPLQPVQASLAEQSAGSQLNPEVESALRRLLAEPEVSATFHDPAVHVALQEVRRDVRCITKYKNDPAVMQAFEKLLEIEDILERL